jgi:ribosomal protein S6 kinase alpha-5
MCRKCVSRKTGQYYAVKILSRYKIDSTNEVKYLTKCQGHENIVKLHDVLQDDLHTYIIMEMLTGGELFERIKRKKTFTEREASAIMKSLISSVQYMHSLGIVHRDLKPENIIFSDETDQAKIKIVDFGFAKQKPAMTEQHQNGSKTANLLQTPCFTLSYAAPEVLNKAVNTNAVGYDESCDLWSLGVILHVMLSGLVPFCVHTQQSALGIVNQKEIIEKIKNSSKSLDFKCKPWNMISDQAKYLIKGKISHNKVQS